mmetsp:Transcript_15397/g.24939  ORF Transcript_15397/g.24939 Transcript_15397/m.24939 type:complete len:90 (-) Transcript_15397:222-491(-)
MHNGRKQEHNKSCGCFRKVVSDAGEVQMSDEPVVDWKVPKPPVGRHFRAVPPVLVENSISKSEKLCKQIQIQVKVEVEHQKPHVRVRDG